MSLTNVLLIHVSTLFLPQTEQAIRKEEEAEYYALLDLPKYAPIAEIRKAYRRISLRLSCDRMMLEWNAPSSEEGETTTSPAVREAHQAATTALNEKEKALKEAFQILGDKHLRQQYHLLQCRPSRYRVISRPLSMIHNLTHFRRWFPLLVLQGVIVAAMVNATLMEFQTQDWVMILIPTWGYYGLVVLFWFFMMEPPWRRTTTLRSFCAMFSGFAQHASLWLGCFWVARYWDADVPDYVNWYILSSPFYAAIAFRCYALLAAVRSLRELQSCMMSREMVDYIKTEAKNNDNHDVNHNSNHNNKRQLPEGYIVVTRDPNKVALHLMNLSMTEEEMQQYSSDPEKMEEARVQSSPEYIQVGSAAKNLFSSMVKLAILGTSFVTLVLLKLENVLDISFWIIFAPVWIHLAMRLYFSTRAPPQPRSPPVGRITNAGIATAMNNTNNQNNSNNLQPQPVEIAGNVTPTNNTNTGSASSLVSAVDENRPVVVQGESSNGPIFITDAAKSTENNGSFFQATPTTTQPMPNNYESTEIIRDLETPPHIHNEAAAIEIELKSGVHDGAAETAGPSVGMLDAENTLNAVDRVLMVDEVDKLDWAQLELQQESSESKADYLDVETGLIQRYVAAYEAAKLESTVPEPQGKDDALNSEPGPNESGFFAADTVVQTKSIFSTEEFVTANNLKEPVIQATTNINFLPSLATGTLAAGSVPSTDRVELDTLQPTTTVSGASNDSPNASPTPPSEIKPEGAADTEMPAVQGPNQAFLEEGPAVREEFERWQSVYENTEVRTSHFQLVPCEVFFELLILCLIVAKLDADYDNDDPHGFNAFLIILIPFSVLLLICCCAIMAGCVELARQEINRTDVNPGLVDQATADQNQVAAAGVSEADSQKNTPMQAGARREHTFSAHIDIPRPDITFAQHTRILTAVLPISTTDAETWLVENNNEDISTRGSRTLWELIIQCADGLDCHEVNTDDSILSKIEAGDQKCLVIMRKNLQAHFQKAEFQRMLDAIKPLDEENEEDTEVGQMAVAEGAAINNVNQGGDAPGAVGEEPEAVTAREDDDTIGIECLVCCEEYRITDTVHCEGEPEIHFFCRPCFHRYATETLQSGDVAGMPCADINCEATFATPTVKSNLSQWEILRMEERENDRNKRVALAAKAVLQCPCGAIGIVAETDVGDGCISCPGTDCGLQYCALCGNLWHPETTCPPTKKMLEWVVQHTMPCPNCHTPIEKNAGCDHMHCAPPGGCGHHFSYRTGKPMSKHGRNLRGLYH